MDTPGPTHTTPEIPPAIPSTPAPLSSPHTWDNLANRLTAIRIAFVPIVVLCLMEDSPLAGFLAALFFGIAAITDYFDGYYARMQKSVTVLGKLMDPLADKFLVVSSIILLMHLQRIHPVLVIILICREFAITGLRAVASAEGIVIDASSGAKWKTATQMAAIPMLMLHETYFYIPFQLLGTISLSISLCISVWSAKDYIVDFFRTWTELAKTRARRLSEEHRLRSTHKRAERLRRMIERDPSLAAAVREVARQTTGKGDAQS